MPHEQFAAIAGPTGRRPELTLGLHQKLHRIGLAAIGQIDVGVAPIAAIAMHNHLLTVVPYWPEQIARLAVGQQLRAECRSVEQIDLIVLVPAVTHRQQHCLVASLWNESSQYGLIDKGPLLASTARLVHAMHLQRVAKAGLNQDTPLPSGDQPAKPAARVS